MAPTPQTVGTSETIRIPDLSEQARQELVQAFPPELLKFKRKHLLAKRKEIMRQITGLLSAIAGGMTNPSISLRLAELEGEKAKVASDILEVEAQIEEATIVRPRAEDVMSSWREMLAGWEELTDPEREEVLQAIVEEVVVTQKDRVHLRLLPFASVHGQFIALNTHLGAGVGFEPTTFEL